MKILDLIGCEYIELSSQPNDSETLTNLYLEHYKKGKQIGYTPIFMMKEMELSAGYWFQFDIPERADKYPMLVKAILDRALSKPFDEWYREIYEKYLLDLHEGDDEEEARNWIEELLKKPSDEQYEAQIKTKAATKLLIQKTERNNLFDEGCFIDDGDVLALIPTSHSYETLAWIPIGGFNWCPTPEYQVAFAKHFCETYQADIMSIWHCQVEMYLKNPLIRKQEVIEAAQKLIVMDNDKYETMEICPRQVYGEQWLSMWWD